MRLAATLLFIGSLAPCYGLPILLTNAANQLLRIDSATPGTIQSTVGITGLQNGENILGIDFRPATGQLYGLGSSNRLYTIDVITGVATQVGAAGQFILNGPSFGFDFDPLIDRLRVTSNAGQNLRLNPNDGMLAGTDTPINGATTTLMGSAYSSVVNLRILYGIDANSDALYRTPNVETPDDTGVYTLVGALGLDAVANIGFDIGEADIAFAAIQTQTQAALVGAAGLYTINLGTGAATLVGQIGPSGQDITGLAIQTPEPATFGLMGLGTAGLLYFARRRARKN